MSPKEVFEFVLSWMIMGVIVFIAVALVTGCAVFDFMTGGEPPKVTDLCTLQVAHQMCWVHKSEGFGHRIQGLSGWLCLAPEDMKTLTDGINRCSHGQPPKRKPLRTLCLLDPDVHMCWTSKIDADGYDIGRMSDWYCMPRPQFRLFTDRLTGCLKGN